MNFFEIAYFGINENFFIGIFHGILFSFPLSIPFLIGFRYFIFNGWISGLSSFLGTISGQLLFFVFLCSGTRPLIQFWYTLEPLLTFLGIALAFQLGTNFYNQRGLGMARSSQFGELQPPGRTELPYGMADPRSAISFAEHGVVEVDKNGASNNDKSIGSSSPDEKNEQGSKTNLTGTSNEDGKVMYGFGKVTNNRFVDFVSKVISFLRPMKMDFLKIFFVQFLFIFLNPIFPALSTRIILSQDILIHFSFLYIFGFFVGAITCIFGIIFLGLIGFSFIQYINEKNLLTLFTEPKWLGFTGLGTRIRYAIHDGAENGTQEAATPREGLANESAVDFVSNRKYRGNRFGNIFSFTILSIDEVGYAVRSFASPQLKTGEAFVINNFFVFCIVGSVLHGSIQYTWRFVTQYPMEFLPVSLWQNLEQDSTKLKPSTSDTWQNITKSITREFPTQDSNIRHREKTLPVERHVPIERINARRTLSGRPGLNEEQKSDAYIKYNSFFLNKIEHSFEDLKIKLRENKVALSAWLPDTSTKLIWPARAQGEVGIPDDTLPTKTVQLELASIITNVSNSSPIFYLRFMKNFYLKYFDTLNSTAKPISILQNPNFTILHKNNTKGKPKFSYIRDLYESLTPFVTKSTSVVSESGVPSQLGTQSPGRAEPTYGMAERGMQASSKPGISFAKHGVVGVDKNEANDGLIKTEQTRLRHTNFAKRICVPLNPYIHDDISSYYIYGEVQLRASVAERQEPTNN